MTQKKVNPYKELYYINEQIIIKQEQMIKLLKERIAYLEENYYER